MDGMTKSSVSKEDKNELKRWTVKKKDTKIVQDLPVVMSKEEIQSWVKTYQSVSSMQLAYGEHYKAQGYKETKLHLKTFVEFGYCVRDDRWALTLSKTFGPGSGYAWYYKYEKPQMKDKSDSHVIPSDAMLEYEKVVQDLVDEMSEKDGYCTPEGFSEVLEITHRKPGLEEESKDPWLQLKESELCPGQKGIFSVHQINAGQIVGPLCGAVIARSSEPGTGMLDPKSKAIKEILHDGYDCRLFPVRDSKGYAMLVSPNRPVYDYENDVVFFPKYLCLHLAISDTDLANKKHSPKPNCAVHEDGFVYAIRRIEPHGEMILSLAPSQVVKNYPLRKANGAESASASGTQRIGAKRKKEVSEARGETSKDKKGSSARARSQRSAGIVV